MVNKSAESEAVENRIRPRLLSREEASAYVGLSPNAFEREVAAGTFPAPVQLAQVRRRLWDIKAIDASIDHAMGIQNKHADWERRKREWREERARKRPWEEREQREREERARMRQQRKEQG